MDSSIPTAAGLILDFIASKEAPAGYGTIYGNKQGKLTKPITSMTLDELIANQAGFTKAFGSSASGRYQFMRATLQGLKTEQKLTGGELFTPDLQDRLAFALLKRRGYAAFIAGTLSRTAFGDQIAMEWASFPVLSASRKGAHRTVTRGQTYYAGDGLNKVLIHPEAVEYVLSQALEIARMGPVAAAPVPPAPIVVAAPALPPIVAPEPAPTPRMSALDRLAAWWLGRKA